MVARVEEHEETKAIEFILKRWRMDKKTKLIPRIEETNALVEDFAQRWTKIMDEFDDFFRKKQLIPKDAEFYYFIEDGAIYAAPRQACEVNILAREP